MIFLMWFDPLLVNEVETKITFAARVMLSNGGKYWSIQQRADTSIDNEIPVLLTWAHHPE